MLSRLVDLKIAAKIAAKIGSALAIVLVASTTVSVLSLRSLSTLEEAGERRRHTYEVLGEISRLTGAMVDQETGVRGCLVSGDAAFLGVADAAAGTGAAASQVLGAASDLSRQSEHLGAEIQRFLTTVRAA